MKIRSLSVLQERMNWRRWDTRHWLFAKSRQPAWNLRGQANLWNWRGGPTLYLQNDTLNIMELWSSQKHFHWYWLLRPTISRCRKCHIQTQRRPFEEIFKGGNGTVNLLESRVFKQIKYKQLYLFCCKSAHSVPWNQVTILSQIK
jgi:hypothetical protein